LLKQLYLINEKKKYKLLRNTFKRTKIIMFLILIFKQF